MKAKLLVRKAFWLHATNKQFEASQVIKEAKELFKKIDEGDKTKVYQDFKKLSGILDLEATDLKNNDEILNS